MRRRIQDDFFRGNKEFAPSRNTHGGTDSKGARKLIRPLSRKRPVHLILASDEAKGPLSMLGYKNKLAVDRIITERARQFKIKLHSRQNVGSHIHILASFPAREVFQDYLRTIAALIARHVTGARKGKPFGRPFWKQLAFTRVITGRRDFQNVVHYIEKNRIEAEFGCNARKAVEAYEAEIRKARRRKNQSTPSIEESG